MQSTTTDATASTELAAVVDELLNSLSNKFAGVSSEIFAKSKFQYLRHLLAVFVRLSQLLTTPLVDEMARRLDNLEATLQNNSDGRDGKSSPTKMQ